MKELNEEAINEMVYKRLSEMLMLVCDDRYEDNE